MDQADNNTTLTARGFDALCQAVEARRRVVCGVDLDELAFRDLINKGYIDSQGRPHVDVTAAIKVKLHRRRSRRR